MRVNLSQASTQNEARLQSPSLPPSSPYCQILYAIMTTLISAFLPLLSLIFVKYLFWYRVVWVVQRSSPPPSFYHATVFPIQHSPLLPSFFPLPRFHFHIREQSAGSLRVLMQQAEGSEAILWSQSHSTVSHWTAAYLPLGPHHQPYKVNARVSNIQINSKRWVTNCNTNGKICSEIQSLTLGFTETLYLWWISLVL